MSELAFLVPVLNRPQNVAPLLRSLEESTPGAHVLFLADKGDRAQCAEIRRQRKATSLQVDVLTPGGSYASKINRGIRCTNEPLIFVGADDLRPRKGWLEAAKAKLDRAQVVGINDLIPRTREHATHFLVTRAYAERGQVDGMPGLLCEDYHHERVDDELIATARYRNAYAYAKDAQVEHLHPLAGHADDTTYRKGRERSADDRLTFLSRKELWCA